MLITTPGSRSNLWWQKAKEEVVKGKGYVKIASSLRPE